MAKKNDNSVIDDLLASAGSVSSGEIAAALGLSRQAAHTRLRGEVDAGRLVAEGEGRARRYRRPGAHFEFSIRGLAEDRVWDDIRPRTRDLATLSGKDLALVSYAFHEMMNNAIEHSGGSRVRIAVRREGRRLVLMIEDDGEGAFEHFRRLTGLREPLEAIQEISKGKATSAPRGHSGEGIFFTSKAVTRFELHAGALRWIVDNERVDQVVLPAPVRRGSEVTLIVALPVKVPLVDVFNAYTEDHEFMRTRTVVKLFGLGTEFVSRSEARRLLHGLERFSEVIVDFQGVEGVGQGFADEVFRVWPDAHPGVRMTPANMTPEVAFMVRRALPKLV